MLPVLWRIHAYSNEAPCGIFDWGTFYINCGIPLTCLVPTVILWISLHCFLWSTEYNFLGYYTASCAPESNVLNFFEVWHGVQRYCSIYVTRTLKRHIRKQFLKRVSFWILFENFLSFWSKMSRWRSIVNTHFGVSRIWQTHLRWNKESE